MSATDQLELMLDLVAGPLQTLVLERLSDGAFRQVGKAPGWMAELVEGEGWEPRSAFPFLQTFLEQAEAVWSGQDGAFCRSGFWTQPCARERLLHLTARAVRLGGASLLLIVRDEDSYRDHQLLAQRGREHGLALEQLRQEVQKKEILVHAIVHDLAVPINAVTGTLGLIEEAPERLPPELFKLVEAASRASHRQAQLVRQILDAFSAEHEELAQVERSWSKAPDVQRAVMAALELVEPQARRQGVRLRVDCAAGADHRVVAEASRLERVLVNLLENAIRFSPRGKEVRVALQPQDEALIALVDDEGPGVPDALKPRLFEKFVQGRGRTGRVGLGLYFCAMMMHRWGGAIAVERAPSGGARFRLRFLRPQLGAPAHGHSLVDPRQ